MILTMEPRWWLWRVKRGGSSHEWFVAAKGEEAAVRRMDSRFGGTGECPVLVEKEIGLDLIEGSGDSGRAYEVVAKTGGIEGFGVDSGDGVVQLTVVADSEEQAKRAVDRLANVVEVTGCRYVATVEMIAKGEGGLKYERDESFSDPSRPRLSRWLAKMGKVESEEKRGSEEEWWWYWEVRVSEIGCPFGVVARSAEEAVRLVAAEHRTRSVVAMDRLFFCHEVVATSGRRFPSPRLYEVDCESSRGMSKSMVRVVADSVIDASLAATERAMSVRAECSWSAKPREIRVVHFIEGRS